MNARRLLALIVFGWLLAAAVALPADARADTPDRCPCLYAVWT